MVTPSISLQALEMSRILLIFRLHVLGNFQFDSRICPGLYVFLEFLSPGKVDETSSTPYRALATFDAIVTKVPTIEEMRSLDIKGQEPALHPQCVRFFPMTPVVVHLFPQMAMTMPTPY